MILQAQITVKGAAKTMAALESIRGSMANPTPLLRSLDLLLKQQVSDTFRLKRDPVDDKAWKATSAATLATRASGGGGTMYSTGALQRNIIARPPIINGFSLVIGSDLVYAVALQGYGGVYFQIAPRHARRLARPVTREAARVGSARRWCDLHKGNWFIRYDSIYLKTNSGAVRSWALMDKLDLVCRPFLGTGPKQNKQIELATVRFLRMGIPA